LARRTAYFMHTTAAQTTTHPAFDDQGDISPERRAQLLDMSYARLFFSITALPWVALCMTGFYALEQNPIPMAVWGLGYFAAFLLCRVQKRAYGRDKAAMPAQAFLSKWRPRLDTLAIAHGLGLCLPLLITMGKGSFEFVTLWYLVLCAIVAGNATHQTPVLGMFMRFFHTSWHISVLLAFWVYPAHWPYIIPMMLLFSAGIYRHAMIAHRFFVQQVRLEERSVMLAEQFKQAKEDAERALSEKNLFLATASHDLRQPVHALGLLVEAISYRSKEPEVAALLADLKSGVRSVNVMFNSLLDLSKLEAGVVQPRPEVMRLQPVLEDVISLFRDAAADRALRLRLFRGQRDAVVLADANLLRRVLVNLIQNALRYTREGGVVVAARRRGDIWQIEVWDSGVGVAEADQQRIFSPYYRQEHAWSVDAAGHGLGLSVVARCAQLMNAPFGMNSRLGKGSRFWIRVPAASAPPVAAREMPLHTALASPLLAPIPGRCLVVEDDPLVSTAWQALLHAWQVDARYATDAASAFAQLDTGFMPQAILCDQRLRSGESGVDILRALLARCPQAQGAMVSGEFQSPELNAARRYGYPVLLKPVDVAQLHAYLAKWLRPD
jgi:signal transduction histidine kinase